MEDVWLAYPVREPYPGEAEPAKMELSLDIAKLTSPGRRPAPLTATVLGELEPHHLSALGAQAVEIPEIKQLRERHHYLARLLASGMGEGEAAAMTGLSGPRVSTLKGMPAFQELLDLYRKNANAEYAEMHARLAGVATDALVELQTRLEDKPEEIGVSALLEIVKLGADRTGFGPTAKQETTINVNLSERLEHARKRARELRDITPPEQQ